MVFSYFKNLKRCKSCCRYYMKPKQNRLNSLQRWMGSYLPHILTCTNHDRPLLPYNSWLRSFDRKRVDLVRPPVRNSLRQLQPAFFQTLRKVSNLHTIPRLPVPAFASAPKIIPIQRLPAPIHLVPSVSYSFIFNLTY